MSDAYKTISTPGTSLYRVKGSKHLGYAMHAGDEDFISEKLALLRKEHHQANHVCYAWRLGVDHARYRSNDDGEPTNSAGPPIMGQIEKYELTNVLVAVVRYFGGTKLGVGGLIEAYRTAAALAIENATIELVQLMAHYELAFGYDRMSDVMLAARVNGWNITGQELSEHCTIQISILPALRDSVERALQPFADIRIHFKGLY